LLQDYMLLCKQEERNLRRVEGDIIRKESNLKVAMRNYENDIYHNQRHQETEAITAEKEEEKIKQHHFIENEKITKERTNKNIGLIHKEKEGDSKVINKLNGLEFKFESIADAIQQKRTEMDSIVKEFEEKLKLKEEEEFRLKKEFANLSIELNMEAQKHRVQKENDKESSNKVSLRNKTENSRRLNELGHKVQAHKERRDKAERSKRRYSQDLHEMIGVMSSQAREDGRRLKDIKVKIEKNTNDMRQSQIKHDLLQMERLGKQSNEKVLAVNARRKEIQDILSQQRKQRNDQTTDEFRMRNLMVNHEIKKQNLDDSIQHLSRVVDRHEDTEHTLYGQVRQLESDRRKQEQNVHSLKQQLLETQKQNKLLLNQTAFRCKQQEIELEQRLLREEADLRKALTEREERIQTLAKYRGFSKEEKYMLEEQRKNQDRLHRIERKTNMILETQPMGKQYETVY
uniref:Uncharacterized protein n=2 Tax=Clytia hemisphaerica TaxID=252671 RepID=A0A7M5V9Z2_9CNID